MVAKNNHQTLASKGKSQLLGGFEERKTQGERGMEATVVISEYQNHLTALGYAEKTVESYRKNLGYFRDFLLSIKVDDLRQVSKQTIADYKVKVMEEKNAMETKALKLRPVKRLFEYLVEENRLFINPTIGLVETCRKNRKIGSVLSLTEIKKLMEQPNLSHNIHIRNRAIMEVFYSTGIRLAELIHLTVHDIDFKAKIIYVRKAKGRKQRVVPLGKTARQYLQEYLDKIRPRYSRKNPSERALFLKNTGKALTPEVIRQAIRDYRVKAKIKKPVSPHTFRRTCATHLLQNGADIRYVQKLLGHSKLSTTQTYTRVIPVDVKKAHEQYHPGIKKKEDK